VRLLIAQADADYAKELESEFHDQSYIVDRATEVDDVLELIDTHDHDVIIVGRNLQDRDGVELCRRLRREGVGTPIIMIAKDDGTEPTVDALDAGADDYVSRPVKFEELFARVRAMVRRCLPEEGSMLRYEGIALDVANRNVTIDNTPAVLTPREFALLEYLMRNRERVVSRNALGDRVWGMEYGEDNSNVVDVYVSRLRRKLKDADKPIIRTVHGTGYMLAATTTDTNNGQSKPSDDKEAVTTNSDDSCNCD